MAVTNQADSPRLRVSELFYSLQGEGRASGLPTVFVRLTGCPLRCGYCDTEYAFSGGQWYSLEQLLEAVAAYDCREVCVTGGEPLAQRDCLRLLDALVAADYRVVLETSGALDVAAVNPAVCKVMDLKSPGSGEAEKNRLENLEHLNPHDQIKLVLCDREDYEWARTLLAEERLDARCEVLFSPAYGRLEPRQLAEWILEDRLPVRLQLQLHKLLWGDVPGH